MTDFTRDVDSMVSSALNPGERVLWTGHCRSRLGQQRKATPALAGRGVMLAVLLAAVSAVSVVAITREPVLAVFAGIGTLLLVVKKTQRFFDEWASDDAMYCRKQTLYMLTNQRAMVLRHCRTGHPVQSLLWAYADEVRAESVGPDGRGTVQFLSWHPLERRWVHSLRFFMVGDARSVAKEANAARDAARG